MKVLIGWILLLAVVGIVVPGCAPSFKQVVRSPQYKVLADELLNIRGQLDEKKNEVEVLKFRLEQTSSKYEELKKFHKAWERTNREAETSSRQK